MRSFSLKSTDENATRLLRDDPIGRNSSVFRFIDLLSHIQESCTIAINGEWGSGKTFFVKQAKLILDAWNDHSEMDDDTRSEIKGCCRQMGGEVECYSTVYYDAWMYDNHEDPILSLVYATIATNQTDYSNEKKRSIIDNAAAIAGALTGRDINKVIESARGKDTFASFKEADDLQELVRHFIDSLILEHGNRLVFFIDELDRCKPDYAIRFLERIKHYFDDERITFVFSVSLSQLQATVKKYYGVDFNATRYLDKFFDLRLTLPIPNLERFMQERLHLYGNSRADIVCIEAAKQYRLSLREAERFARVVKICIQPAVNSTSNLYSGDNACFFSMTFFLPIMIVLQMTDMQAYTQFVSGENPQPFLDLLRWPNQQFDSRLILANNEKLDETRQVILSDKNSQTTKVAIEDRLKEVYEAFFSKHEHPNSQWGDTIIGQLRITDRTKDYISNVVSMLSQWADYEYK